ncbi:MAG TPA: hypothetical protein VN541_08650, partial [Tepidisphaeraceae bacterium]|nr:hypothetical protein [Tepidisphaeraceae bacterium]
IGAIHQPTNRQKTNIFSALAPLKARALRPGSPLKFTAKPTFAIHMKPNRPHAGFVRMLRVRATSVREIGG